MSKGSWEAAESPEGGGKSFFEALRMGAAERPPAAEPTKQERKKWIEQRQKS